MHARLALVGDIHGQWDRSDVEAFNGSDHDGLLITGDLPGDRLHRDDVAMAERLAGLTKPAVWIPGNHDGPGPLDVLREALWRGISHRGARRMAAKMAAMEAAVGPVQTGGYSVHDVGGVTVVVARPHAMDSRKLTFAPYLADRYGVRSLAESADRIVACIEQTTGPYVILAHNGPHGFGKEAADPWGLSLFDRDNGDPDLADAIARAHAAGRPPVAVVTGHMHWNGRRPRTWQLERDGVLYVNAARVPRVSRGLRRHVALTLSEDGARAELIEA